MSLYVPALLVFLYCSSITAALELNDLLPGADLDTIFSPRAINLSSYYLFVGQILNVTCSLPYEDIEKGFSSRDIHFRHSQSKTCFSPENVTLINNQMAMLTFPVTIESDGSYQCTLSPNCQKELIGSSEKLNVEYWPQRVVNFSCEVFYGGNGFEISCQWDYPISYIYPSDLNVTFCFREFILTAGHLYCNNVTGKSYKWKSNSLPYVNYTIYLTVFNNKVRTARISSTFLIDSSSLVKPDSVTTFTVNPSPHCFSFNWTSSFCRLYRCTSRIYISTSSNIPEEREILSDDLKGNSFKKCNFSANTHYKFCVQLHPSGHLSGFWSNPVCKEGTTPITAPSASPQITLGSYVYADDSCLGSDLRKITLFWKPLEDTERNGALDGYHITINENRQIASSDSFSATVNLACGEEYVISISAFNSKGSSPMPSQWPLEPFPRQLKVPDHIQKSFAANISGDKVTASWNPESSANSYRKFIYWCKGTSSNQKCEEELSWSEVQNQQQMMALPVDSQKASQYLYGISLQNKSSNASSGIFWTSCLLQNNEKVDVPRFFDVDASDGEIVVKWFNEDCSYERKYKIIGHLLKWCLNAKCKEKFVAYPERKFTLPEVLPGHTYNVTMKTLTLNKESDFLPWKRETSKVQDESSDFVVIFIAPVATLVIFVILCFVVLCGVNKWRYTVVHKFFEEIILDDLWTLPDYMEYIPPEENLAHDHNSIETSNNDASVSSVESSPPLEQLSTQPSVSSSSQSYSSSDYDQRSGARLLPKVKFKKKKKNPQKGVPDASNVLLTNFKTQSGASSTQNETSCSEVWSTASQVTEFNDSSCDIYTIVKEIDPHVKDNNLNSKRGVHMNGIVPPSASHEGDQKCIANVPPLIYADRLNRENSKNVVSFDHSSGKLDNSKSCNKKSPISRELEVPQTINQFDVPALVKIPSDQPSNNKQDNNMREQKAAILSVSSIGTIHQHQQRDLRFSATQASDTIACNTEHPDYVSTMPSNDSQSDMVINGNGNNPQVGTRTPTTYPGSEHDNTTKMYETETEMVKLPIFNDTEHGSMTPRADSEYVRRACTSDTETSSSSTDTEYVKVPCNSDEYVRPPCNGNGHEERVEISHSDHVRTLQSVNDMHDVGNGPRNCEEYLERIPPNYNRDDSELLTEAPSSSTDTEYVRVPVNCDDYVRLPCDDDGHEERVKSSHSDHVRTLQSVNDMHDVGNGPRNCEEYVEGIPPDYNRDDSELLTEAPSSSTDTEYVRVPVNCDDYVRPPCDDDGHEERVESSHSDHVRTLQSVNDMHPVGSGPRQHDKYLEGIPPNDNDYVRPSGAYNEDREGAAINEVGTEYPDGMPFNETDNGNDLLNNESENFGELSGDDSAHVDVFPRDVGSQDEIINMSPSASIVV